MQVTHRPRFATTKNPRALARSEMARRRRILSDESIDLHENEDAELLRHGTVPSDADADADDDDDDAVAPPPSVRTESQIEKLPSELLKRMAILHLSIYDLSRLSRTCTKLASRLSKEGIWDGLITATLPWVKTVGGLSKLQAIQLVLGTTCQECGRAVGVQIYWFWNRRECYKCISEVTISSSALNRQYKVPPIAFEHLYSTPYSVRRTRGLDDKGERYLLSQVNMALAEYEKATKEGSMGVWLMDCTLTKHKRTTDTSVGVEMEKAAKLYMSDAKGGQVVNQT
ncbi:hypothetical protein SeMB42_g04169 [Synchytrium endobioticum]|uniref:F-box domain-containing protein n=1 Tax=Synchytrium endobioticum TaxID=286115 RepID=A0A507DGH6_9FUNG|nr:hypothetical protein SeMB42_g04169 [Synchytrium endobioticum]TPX50425.1 hypothetical protein SeLEV6574_g00902 [Synchytrium endobioticum]